MFKPGLRFRCQKHLAPLFGCIVASQSSPEPLHRFGMAAPGEGEPGGFPAGVPRDAFFRVLGRLQQVPLIAR